MTTEQSTIQPPTRAKLHPVIWIAALSVAAVSLIAAAQLLSPKLAQSQPAAQSPPAPQQIADVKVVPKTTPTATTTRPKEVAATACVDCGVVVAVRESKQAGEGTGVGAVAGGVLGGVVGHQIGGGRGKDLATVAGAVGGAFAGHQVEKQARATVVYQVDVRMEDGSTRTVTQAAPLAVGAKVRVAGNQITQRG